MKYVPLDQAIPWVRTAGAEQHLAKLAVEGVVVPRDELAILLEHAERAAPRSRAAARIKTLLAASDG